MTKEQKSPSLLPIMLQLNNRKVVVIGGGKIATRRIMTLLQLQLTVYVVSPQVTAEIKRLHEQHKLRWLKKDFTEDDLTDATVIIAATNCTQVNMQIFHSVKNNQLVNLVDRPDLSDFHFPAICSRGQLLISISTSGASPGLAKKIKHDIDIMFPNDYEKYIEFLSSCRNIVQTTNLSIKTRNHILRQLLHPRFEHMGEQEREQAFNHLLGKESRRQI